MKCVDCMYFTRQNGDNGYCSEFVQPVNVRCGCEIDKVKDAFKEPRPDLVEVVRCRDCKNWDTTFPDVGGDPNYHYCDIMGWKVGEFYCAKGERRDDE